MLSSRRARGMIADTWLRRHGPRSQARWPTPGSPADGASAVGRLRCDALGCILRKGSWTVAISRDARALAEDCGGANIVISLVPVRGRCPTPEIVVDRFDLWREGGHAVWLGEGGAVRVDSVNTRRGRRPWTRRRGHD